MNIECKYEPSFGGYVTYMVFPDGDVAWDDFAWTKEELFLQWRVDLDMFEQSIRQQVLRELEDELGISQTVLDNTETKPEIFDCD